MAAHLEAYPLTNEAGNGRTWLKPLGLLAFAVLSALLIVFGLRTFELADSSAFYGLLDLTPALVACAAGFALSKGALLRAVAHAHGVEGLSWLGATALFCESSAVALASFPGALNADVYKLARLRTHPRPRVLRTLVHYRLALWCAVGLTVLGALLLRPFGFGLVHLFVWAAAMALGAALATATGRLVWVAPLLWALAAVAVDGLAACLLLNKLLGAGALELLATHLGAHVLGALTQLPFGLGGFDLGYAWQLQNGLSAGALAAFLAAYRLSGPCLTAIVGWALVAKRAGRWLFSADQALDSTQPATQTP